MQSLYESWELRRQLLESNANPIDVAIAQIQKRILDFLLRRYATDTAAKVPASFPARTELRLDRRAIVVHDHMGRGIVSGVKNEVEASDRAARILKRISNLDPQASAQSPGRGIYDPLLAAALESEMPPEPNPALHGDARGGIAAPVPGGANLPAPTPSSTSITYRQRLAWGRIHSGIKAGEPAVVVLDRIRGALSLGRAVPERAITYMFEHCSNPLMKETLAADLLARCINSSVPAYALLAWRDRLVALSGPDEVANRLRSICLQEPMRPTALKNLRPSLADSHAIVRIEAAKLLADLGNLHDVGLLLDLAALPPQSDEDPSERGVLLNSAEQLAGCASV
jgi:hypothetical protein